MSVPNQHRVSLSSATVKLGLLLRDLVSHQAPLPLQQAAGGAARAVEEAARQQLHQLRESMRHMTPADATYFAVALARCGMDDEEMPPPPVEESAW
jgi:hypothetical protein